MPRPLRALAAALLAVLCGCSVRATPGQAAAIDRQDFPTIARGRYLAIAGDCGACHTTPGSGHLFAGGRPIETPFGNVVAANITPDVETGIGSWSDDDFVNALLKGVGKGGQRLYPAMPFTYYTHMSRDDALAIRAYLSTVPAVRNDVVSDQLPFPFDIRANLWAWDTLFFKPGTLQPVAGKSVEWNRGAYLVEGPMHCGMCHTPKNLLGGDKSSQVLQGYSLQGWFAPDITNANYRGLGGWTTDEIVAYLKTGHNAIAAATGPMGEEVADSSSQMTDADLHAIAAYLKDEPDHGPARPTPVAATDASMKVGGAIYRDECAACHRPDGKGTADLIPALAGSGSVQSREPTSVLHVVLFGTRSVGTAGAPTAPAMPPFNWLLNDEQVAAVATYVRNAWGNAAPAVSGGDAGSARRTLAQAGE